MKPRVFIASSVEGLNIAYAVQENLEHDAECTVWSQGVFTSSAYPVDDLLAELDNSDFGIFVFSADDIVKMREEESKAIRDNVVFEIGLFIGRLGRSRNFMVQPNDDGDLHIPSDLAGLSPLKFDANRQDKNTVAALGASCNKIRYAIRKLGPVTETVDKVVSELDEKCLKMMAAFGPHAFFSAPDRSNDNSLAIDEFNHAVNRLRSLKTIRFDTDGTNYAYHWTDLGKLVLEKFGYDKALLLRAIQPTVSVSSGGNFGISETARILLLIAVQTGKVYMSSTMQGLTIQTQGRMFCDGTDVREEARWRGAVGDLESRRLLEDLGHKREVFTVTNKGYEVADKLKA